MSTHIKNILLASMLAGLLSACRMVDESAMKRHEFSRLEMGMPVRMILYSDSPSQARLAAKTAFDRIRSLNQILSDYEDDSELNQVRHSSGSGEWLTISRELWSVMRRSDQLAKETGGAFDITAGPLIQLWKRARRQRALPTTEKLTEAMTRVGHYYIDYRETDRSLVLWQKGMRLDLGGIAKGFAMDEAMKVLKQEGINRALITGGGDMVASASPPGKAGWKIELPQLGTNATTQFIRLKNGAFATSGDRYQFVILDGKRYSHIVDPRSGIALTNHRLVYVIARDGVTADSLATATSVLDIDEALSLARAHRAELKIQIRTEEETLFHASPGFDDYLWP